MNEWISVTYSVTESYEQQRKSKAGYSHSRGIVLMCATPFVLIQYVTMEQSVCTQNETCLGCTNC